MRAPRRPTEPGACGSCPAWRGRAEPPTGTQEALASHVGHSLRGVGGVEQPAGKRFGKEKYVLSYIHVPAPTSCTFRHFQEVLRPKRKRGKT